MNDSAKPNPVESGARARYLAPEDIYAGSGLMVFGTVSDVTTRLYDNGMVYTEVIVKLEEIWKGSQPGGEILIRQPGGTADGVTTVSGPRLACRKGEQWLFGLALIRQDWWTVYAVTQGSFRIEDGNAVRDYSEYNLSRWTSGREVIPLDDIRRRLGIPIPAPQNKDKPESGVINRTGDPASSIKPTEKITTPVIQPGAAGPKIPLTGKESPGPDQGIRSYIWPVIIGLGLFILVFVLLLRRRRLKHSGITKILVLLMLFGVGSVSQGFLQLAWTPVPSGGIRWNVAAQTPANFFQSGKIKYRLITAGVYSIPSESYRYAYINAFQTWEDSANCTISFVRGSDITAAAYDQDFSVGFTDSFDNSQWGGSLTGFAGVASYTYAGSYFTNVDICLRRGASWSTDGSTSTDVEEVALHEIGHAIGLHHSPYAQSSMSYVSSWDPLLPGIGNIGIITGGRRLSSDDQIGANVLYPVGTRGSIHGTITRVGINVDAALIAVYDSLSRTVTTTYSRSGVYHIDGLLPGAYTLKIQPTYTTSDLNVEAGSLPWDLTPTVFAANDSTNRSVTVTAGNTTTSNITVPAGTPTMRITRAVREYAGTYSWDCGLRIRRGANNVIGLAGTGMPEASSGLASLTFDGGGITINWQEFDGEGFYTPDWPLGSGSTTIWLDVSVASNATLGMRALTLVTTGGERAVLPSFLEVYEEGTLAGAIGGNNPPAGIINAGATDYEMLQGAFTAGSLEPMRLRKWTINNSGTGLLSDVTAVKVYYDADSNGTVGGSDVLLGSGVFSGTSATIYSAYTVPAGTSQRFLVAYDFTSTVVGGKTYLAAISELEVWGVDSARPVTPSGLPLSGNTQTGIDRPPVLTSPGNKNVDEGQLLSFTLSATDPDLDTITYSMAGTPTGATVNSASGVFSWTPGYTQSGSYVVTFTARANLLSDSKAITITVNNVDSPPTLTSPGDKSVNEGQLLTFTLSATDPESDPISYSMAGTPTGAAVNSVSGVFSWTPYYTQSGSYVVTFTARANLLSDSKAITITVIEMDNPPVLTSPGDKSVNETELLTFTLSATDPESDPISYSMANTPTGSTLNSVSGVFSWTPNYTQAGIYAEVIFTATANGLPDSKTIVITVNNIDRPPVLVSPGDKNVDEGQLLSFTLSASDPDLETLTYSMAGTPTGATLNRLNGLFSWTPNYYQSGSHSVTFTATANGAPDSKVITITVNNVNGPPVLTSPGNKSVNENQLLSFTLSASDPDLDAITYSMVGTPTGSTFDSVTGLFSWTPDYTQAGSYPVTFTATANGASDTKGITITVANTDRPPTLTSPGNQGVNENALLTFTLTATDPDLEAIAYSMVGTPTGATVNSSSGVFSWTPSYAQAGSYSVTFTAKSNLLSDSKTITISVNNIDRPPVLTSPGNKNVNENQLLSFTLSASDPDLETIAYSMVGTPTGATVNSASGAFSWTPDYTQAGSYPVTFTATANGASDTKGITITVTNADRAPVLTSPGNKSVNENQLLAFTLSASDPDGDIVDYYMVNTPTGAALNSASGAFSWTPDYAQSGNYAVTFTARANLLSDSKVITINVGNIDRPPVLASPGDNNVNEGELLSFTLSASDPDGNTIVYSMVNTPTGAALNSASGVFSWTPSYAQAGSYAVTFTARANLLSDSKDITISVNDIDRPPVLTSPGNRNANENQLLSFALSASDLESDSISYSMAGAPTGSALNSSSGIFSWTPNYYQAGDYTVTFTASSTVFSDSQTIIITVNNVNGPPVLASPGDQSIDEGQALSFTLVATDPDDDIITYSMGSTPTGATLNPVTGLFSWTPNYTQAQDYMVIFSATANGVTNSKTVIITVGNIAGSGSSGTSPISSGSSGQGKGGMCGLFGPEIFLLFILLRLFRSACHRWVKQGR